MRNIFIVNPCAGQGKNIDFLISQIKKASKKLKIDTEIYVTNFVGDAEVYVHKLCENNENGEQLRFFACGGDGTLNEVVNGIVGFDNVSVGAVPVGTGNDYIRNYGSAKDFMDIKKQLTAADKKVDIIKYSGMIDGKEQTRYCINMFNIGFDCNVVDKTAELKKKPLLKGSSAYLCSIGTILIKKKGANLRVSVDGEVVHDGPLLLTAIACGSYCGGGVYSSPQAKTDDGLMDVNIVNNVSRTRFLKIFPRYSKGTHFEMENIEEVVIPYACKTAIVEPLDDDKTMRLCTDGEITTTGTICMEVMAKAVRFVIPL